MVNAVMVIMQPPVSDTKWASGGLPKNHLSVATQASASERLPIQPLPSLIVTEPRFWYAAHVLGAHIETALSSKLLSQKGPIVPTRCALVSLEAPLAVFDYGRVASSSTQVNMSNQLCSLEPC